MSMPTPVSNSPIVFPSEIVGEIIAHVYQNLPTRALKRCAVASRVWFHEAKPFIFGEAAIIIEPPLKKAPERKENTRRRIQTLLKLVKFNPDIAKYAHHLKITLRPLESTRTLNDYAATLLQLAHRLGSIRTFTFIRQDFKSVWNGNAWWNEFIEENTRDFIRYMCSLPSLRHLGMDGGEIPTYVYIHNPHLQSLSIRGRIHAESPKGDELGYPSIKALTLLDQGVDEGDPTVFNIFNSGSLNYLTVHHPRLLQSLTTLHYDVGGGYLHSTLQRALELSKETLVDLTYKISLNSNAPLNIDLADLACLRSLTLSFTLNGNDLRFPHLSTSLPTLPRSKLKRLRLSFINHCEFLEAGSISDMIHYWNNLDSMLSDLAPQEVVVIAMTRSNDAACLPIFIPFKIKDFAPRLVDRTRADSHFSFDWRYDDVMSPGFRASWEKDS